MKYLSFLLFLLSTLVCCTPKVSVKGIATLKVPKGATMMTDQEWIDYALSPKQKLKTTRVTAIHYRILEGVLTLNGGRGQFEDSSLQEDQKTYNAMHDGLPGAATSYKIINGNKVLIVNSGTLAKPRQYFFQCINKSNSAHLIGGFTFNQKDEERVRKYLNRILTSVRFSSDTSVIEGQQFK